MQAFLSAAKFRKHLLAVALRAKFPAFYQEDRKKRKRGDIHEEGYKFPQDQHDWLLDTRMCEVVKPVLAPGDALIWSSALPHCGATMVSSVQRRARLGVITAFAPAVLVPEHIRMLRIKTVGGGFATGQQVIHASKHGSDFPSALRRFAKPDTWPDASTRLQQRRAEYRTVPLYVERDNDDDATRTWRRQIRSLLHGGAGL